MKRVKKALVKIMFFDLLLSPAFLSGQALSDGSMPQFLYPQFNDCKVIMKNGQVQASLMNFNMVSGLMVFERDGKYYDLTNPEMVDTVFLQASKFVPVGKSYYEILVPGPVSLFIQHKGTLMPAGKPAGYGGTSQLSASTYISSISLSGGRYNLPLPSEYIVRSETIYWICDNNKWYDFTNEKQFLKAFPEKADKLKGFIKANRLKFDNEEHLIKLVKFLKTL